jgi:WD40 repeat protein
MAYAWDFFNIMAFDLNTGERIYKRNTNGFVNRILPLKPPKAIVVGDLSIWDLKLGQPSEPALQHDGHEGVAVSGDRTKIVTWSRNGEVRLWNADAQSQLGKSMFTGNWITGALFNKRGDRLIVWSSNELSIWDVKTQARIGDALPFRDVVSQVRLIGNERLAVLIGQRIELWDIASRQRAGSPITVPSGAADFAIMRDAGHVVTWGGVESKIRIWDLASRQQMGAPPRTPGLLGAQLTKDGKKILWWNSEKVFLWPLDWAGDGNLIDFACKALADQGVDVIKNRYGVAVEPICTHSWSMVPQSYWDQLGN